MVPFAHLVAIVRSVRRLRTPALACALAACSLSAQAPTAGADIYFGATISGETYGQTGSAPLNSSAWDLFERHAGKRVAVLNQGQRWTTFNKPAMDATRARGAIPMVTMGLSTGVTLAGIVSGEQDAAIRSWARAAKEWGHPFFFGPWWEMNGAWYSWGQDPNFVAAWRRFHDLVVAEGATNVTWTWVTNSIWYDPASDPTPYYPGDAYVDWVGIDTYNWGRNPAQPDRWINPDQTITPTLDRVTEFAPQKPVIIVENASSEIGGNKADWIREMLGTYLPSHRRIGAYLWFNWNFPKPTGRADWPIESSAPAQQAFRGAIQSSVYRSTPPPLPALAKVPPPPEDGPADGPLPTDLSPAGETALAPQVAVAPDGTATVVWSGERDSAFAIFARRIAPDGTPQGTVRRLSDPQGDSLSPQVAVAPDGTATVVWIHDDGSNFVVQTRRIAPDSGLEPGPTDLSVTGRDAADPQVAVAPDGTATAVWKRFDGFHFLVKERRIAPDGTPGPPADTLSEAHQDAVEPRVGVAADGSAFVVWSRFDGASSRVQGSRIGPDGTPGATLDLSAAEANAVQPQLAVAPDGTANVVWSRFDGADFIVQHRRIAPGGVPDPMVSDLSAPGQGAAEPELAVGPDGTATAVWERYDGTSFVVQARRLSAGGVPAATVNLSAPGRDAAEPQISIRADGGATVVWSRFDGADFIVQRRDLSPAGAPEAAVVDLSAPGRGASGPQVAIGPAGTLATIWKRFDGADDIVQGLSIPGALASISPGSRDFGPVQVGSAVTDSFRITNHGRAPLSISSLSIVGADATHFPLADATACTEAPLPPQSNCEFSLAFRPVADGARQAQVEVISNAGSSPDFASVAGTGVNAAAPTVTGPAAGSATAPPRAPRPRSPRVAGRFRIGRPILDTRRGTAKLPVTVPGPGRITLLGPRRRSRTVRAAATVMLPLVPQGAMRKRLRRSGFARLRVVVRFDPRGGSPSDVTKVVGLRRSLPCARAPLSRRARSAGAASGRCRRGR